MTWKLSNNPRDWQKVAIQSWVDNKYRGIAKVVTGGGKTFFALMCTKQAIEVNPNLRFFVVVPTVALRDQWCLDAIEDMNVSRSEIFLNGIDRKVKLNHKFVIIVINSAREKVHQITQEGDWMLIVDECHRAASEKNRLAISGTWFATLGLSATPERQYDDWFERYLKPVLGEFIADYDYVRAKKDGVISDFKLRNYLLPTTDEEEEELRKINRSIAIEYSRIKRLNIEQSPKLMNLLLKRSRFSQSLKYRIPIAIKIAENFIGKKIIIFHESIEKANQITRLLDKKGFRVVAYHSKLSPMEKLSNLDFFRQGVKDVLVTCKALDEGLNVKDAEVGIIVASTKSIRQRIQRMGRVLRSSDSKEFATVVTLYSHSEKSTLIEEAKKFDDVAEITWYGRE